MSDKTTTKTEETKKTEEKTETYTGTCDCKSVTFTCTGKPLRALYCHCSICARHGGVDRMLLCAWACKSVTIEGEKNVGSVSTSEGLTRHWCTKCGNVLWGKNTKYENYVIPPIRFASDDKFKIPTEMEPSMHLYCLNAVLPVSDKSSVPLYSDLPTSFGGSGKVYTKPENKSGEKDKDDTVHEGSCFGGCVKFTCKGAPVFSGICHCTMCAKFNGGDRAFSACYKELTITSGKDYLNKYSNTTRAERFWCTKCGGRLWTYTNTTKSYFVPCTIFGKDDKFVLPESFKPSSHIFCDSSIIGVDPKEDSTVKYVDMPKEYGGSGKTL